MENTKNRTTWTVHMDRDLFEKVKAIAEAEGRTIRGQFERIVRDALHRKQRLETRREGGAA